MQLVTLGHFTCSNALLLLAAALIACDGEASAPGSSTRDATGGAEDRPFANATLDAGRDAQSARTLPDARAARDAQVADSGSVDDAPTTKRNDHGKGPGFCRRDGADAVRDLFCGDSPPTIRSLRELQDALRMNPFPRGEDGETAVLKGPSDPDAIVSNMVVIAHSTALSGHLVSPLNPRVILLNDEAFLTYQRGVQQVEIATIDRERGSLSFFLLSFTQACNDSERGCTPGDLYTPRVESNWLGVTVQDDEELKNTSLDCRQCHQRGRDQPTLLMRELESPWTHFFELHPENKPPDALPGVRGRDLVQDFLDAKGDETYAGVPALAMRHTVGLTLQNAVGLPQPLLFDAPGIEDERWPFGADGYAEEPNRSQIWDRAFAAFQRGEQLALPYFEQRATDPQKQAKLSEAYQRYRRGELSAEKLPDLADIYPDDPQLRAEIGLATVPGASAPEALVQACASCHNDVLDQTISRARFNVDLARMSRAELDLAIARISLPATAPGVMPPPEFRKLTSEAKSKLLDYLRRDERSPADDELLQHAAKAGMTGGAEPADSR